MTHIHSGQHQSYPGETLDDFIYLPESNALVNLKMISLIRFSGSAETPACNLYVGCNNLPVELRGRDVARLLEFMHIDFQAVQTDLQQSHSADVTGRSAGDYTSL